MEDGKGFERWLQRRAAKGATTPTGDDDFYRAFVSAATGADAETTAGVAYEEIPGGAVVPDHISDDSIYQGFVDMLSGKAARERARQDVDQDFRDRRQEARRHAREMGTPIPPQYRD